MRWWWPGIAAVLIVAVVAMVNLRPPDPELPDPRLGYTPQADVHGMLLAERLYADLTAVFTSPGTGLDTLPPYPGSRESLADLLDEYRDVLARLEDGRLCLSGAGCPERDRMVLRGIVQLLDHADMLQQMSDDGRLSEDGIRRVRAGVMDAHAGTLAALADTFTGAGGDVFRQGADLARLNAIATRSAGQEGRDETKAADQAKTLITEAIARSRALGVDGGPGGELSRSVVRLRGAEMLDANTVEPEALLTLLAHMFQSVAPVRGAPDLALDPLDEHLIAGYDAVASSLRWTMIRQLDPPPARDNNG